MPVAQRARLPDWLRHMQRNKAIETKKKLKTETTFSEVKHSHDKPVASFECSHAKKSIIYVTMRKLKAPVNISRSKPKRKKCGYRHTRKTSGTARESTLAPSIILLTWAPLQSFHSCSIINSLFVFWQPLELSTYHNEQTTSTQSYYIFLEFYEIQTRL